jgi:DNA-binding transcriptional ArsR family regulator
VLAVLNTPRRIELLRLIWSEERSAGELHRQLPDVTFGAVSQHLRRLERAGLVAARRAGRHRYYRARPEAVASLHEWLESMWDSALYRLKLQAELEAARRGPRARARRAARPASAAQPRATTPGRRTHATHSRR